MAGARAARKSRQRLPFDFTEEDARLCSFLRPFTLSGFATIKVLASAIAYIEKHRIEGDIVECGVWRGGQMMAAAMTLAGMGSLHRDLYLFDTFAGMSPPSEVDVDYAGRTGSSYLRRSGHVAVVPLEQVQVNMAKTAYPADKIKYVKGRVEDTVPGQAPERIALLRLDTDWYESTRHELVHLFPRVTPYGVVIIDDYGHFKGSQKAVDEYLETCSVPLFLGRIDYSGRIIIKSPPLTTPPLKT